MRNFTLLLFALFLSVGAGAQEKLNQELSGFELFENGRAKHWWIIPSQRSNVQVVDEKGSNSKHSLKISVDDFGKTTIFTAQLILPEHKGIDLPKGDYILSVDVFLPESAPVGYIVALSNPKTQFYKAIPVKVSNIEKRGGWVTVTEKFKVDHGCKDCKLSIGVREDARYGGVGTIYFDNISIKPVK